MMDLLLSTFETVAPTPPYPEPWERLADPWDLPIWAAVRVGNAQYVVSENRNDFPPEDDQGRHRWEGVEYVTGDTFLRILEAIGD